MEEFASNEPGTEADSLLPTEKRLTVQPIHGNLQVDAEGSAQIAASHANSTPIANIASDQESTSEEPTVPVPTAAEAPLHGPPKVAEHAPPAQRNPYHSIIIMAIIIATLLVLLLIR